MQLEPDKKKWTIMVYMAGGRDISDEARQSLLQMKQVGSSESFNVIAQFDSGSEGGQTKRYYLRPLGTASEIDLLLSKVEWLKTPVLEAVLELDNVTPKNLEEPDAGNPAALKGFVDWALENFPASRTMLIIWGHGDGFSVAWDVTPTSRIRRKKRKTGTRPSAGRTTETELTPGELRKAFKSLITRRGSPRQTNRNKLIDIFGFDSCQMGTVEVYHQLTDIAGFAIGSEGFSPKKSWPYRRILKALRKKPNSTPRELATITVDSYYEEYSKGFGDGIDLSACSLSKLPVNAISLLVKPLQDLVFERDQRLIAARMDTQSYNDDFVDLHDLCQQLTQQLPERNDLRNACRKTIAAIKRAILVSRHRGREVEKSNGISIYFPHSRVSRLFRRYETLQIEGSDWKQFLDSYSTFKNSVRLFDNSVSL
jgi:hypothetical protein